MADAGPKGIIAVMMVMMVVLVKGSEDASTDIYDSCQMMRGECRIKTYKTSEEMVYRNASCYCTYEEEVSSHLDNLRSVRCFTSFGQRVNVSILHIVGCNVTSQEPLQYLLDTFRRTSDHMELYVERSSRIRLASPSLVSPSLSSNAPDTITATFINSNISGMPEGVVSGATSSASIILEGCEVDVLESRSFSGYGPDANVTITFRDTKILTVKMMAFDLPRKGRMEIQGGEVVRFEGYSYSGGAELTLDGMKGAILPESTISIYGLRKLIITNCTLASVYHHALGQRPPSYARNITMGSKVVEGTEVIFSSNKILSGNGQAFAQFCKVDKIKWNNNTLLMASDMPLRLQGPECTTERNWSHVFSHNGLSNTLNCEYCGNFTNPDDQTCALFASSYCISCETPMDRCNKPVLSYIPAKCEDSHPDIAKALRDTCMPATSSRTPKALYTQDGGGSSGDSLRPLSLVVSLCVALLLSGKV